MSQLRDTGQWLEASQGIASMDRRKVPLPGPILTAALEPMRLPLRTSKGKKWSKYQIAFLDYEKPQGVWSPPLNWAADLAGNISSFRVWVGLGTEPRRQVSLQRAPGVWNHKAWNGFPGCRHFPSIIAKLTGQLTGHQFLLFEKRS